MRAATRTQTSGLMHAILGTLMTVAKHVDPFQFISFPVVPEVLHRIVHLVHFDQAKLL